MNNFITVLKKILGGILIIVGIIGLFLPFLQGLLMLAAGAALLHNHWLDGLIKKLKVRICRK